MSDPYLNHPDMEGHRCSYNKRIGDFYESLESIEMIAPKLHKKVIKVLNRGKLKRWIRWKVFQLRLRKADFSVFIDKVIRWLNK